MRRFLPTNVNTDSSLFLLYLWHCLN